MRVAVIGAGISGLVSAYVLAKTGVDVVLFEKEDYLGGHAKTVSFDSRHLDLGFMVFNRVTIFFSYLHSIILNIFYLNKYLSLTIPLLIYYTIYFNIFYK